MALTTLAATEDLAARLGEEGCAVVDCRFDLADPDAGEHAYRAGHVPGAVYARLDRDLAGARTGRNGRHPLPDVDAFSDRLGGWGIDGRVQVLAYDDGDGMFASRLWWMLRYLGHRAVAVVEGGYARWTGEGRPVRGGVEARPRREFQPSEQRGMLATLEEVARAIGDPSVRLIDARSPERFRGAVEPIDPVAGHIPGAVNRHYRANLGPADAWKSPDVLRDAFRGVLGDVPAERAIAYCGSGVSACHDLLALEHAGLRGARLYPGSWSEWSADAARPVERGDPAGGEPGR